MLTEIECLSKVADLHQLATLSPTEELRASYMKMAGCWQRVAIMAAWQDHFVETSPLSPNESAER